MWERLLVIENIIIAIILAGSGNFTLIDPHSVIRIQDLLLFPGVVRGDRQIHNGMFKQIKIILQRLLLRNVAG